MNQQTADDIIRFLRAKLADCGEGTHKAIQALEYELLTEASKAIRHPASVDEIKEMVLAGTKVFYQSQSYEVRYWPKNDSFVVVCTHNGHAIGLTWQDGVTLNGKLEDFFIA